MASQALMERPVEAPTVTAEQMELVRRTVANGATADELKLYLYDCARQGVHPLDKLLHFTKRGGKYTPVTSIDLMRTRAADTGEYAGSDDAAFQEGPLAPSAASVTVWRLVQGQRCAFTATARWDEYYPGDAAGSMWRKMPHTMLAKCAEALALRKGFPRQLAGLYAREELDQAERGESSGYSVQAPAATVAAAVVPSVPNGDSGASAPDATVAPRDIPQDGQLRIERIDATPTKNPNVTRYAITFSSGEVATTVNQRMAGLAEQFCQDGTPVRIETKKSRWGTDLMGVYAVVKDLPSIDINADLHAEPVNLDEIPFGMVLAVLTLGNLLV